MSYLNLLQANFNYLASLCSWGDWFESHFFGNPRPVLSRRGPYGLQHEISNNVVCVTSKGSDQPAHIGVSKLKRRLHRLFWVYTRQRATLLEIKCHGSYSQCITNQQNDLCAQQKLRSVWAFARFSTRSESSSISTLSVCQQWKLWQDWFWALAADLYEWCRPWWFSGVSSWSTRFVKLQYNWS